MRKKNQLNENHVELYSIIPFKIKKIPGRREGHTENPFESNRVLGVAGVGSIDVGSHRLKDEHRKKCKLFFHDVMRLK